MVHHGSPSKIGSNIYSHDDPDDIDLMCLNAVAYWYNEIKSYDFNNPKYADKTGTGNNELL